MELDPRVVTVGRVEGRRKARGVTVYQYVHLFPRRFTPWLALPVPHICSLDWY